MSRPATPPPVRPLSASPEQAPGTPSEQRSASAPPAHAREGLGPRTAAALWLAILLVAAGRVAATWRTFNATIDEGRHVAAAVEVWQSQRYSVYFGNPPLQRYFTGLLPYLHGARLPAPEAEERELAPYIELTRGDREHALGKYVLEAGPDYWGVLVRARAGNLVFLALLLAVVYRWAADLFGRAGGLFATALLSSSPLLLGHAALATTDVAGAFGALLSTYLLWRWAERPGVRSCVLAAAGFGIAFCCKPTIPPFLLLAGAISFALVRWRRWLDPASWGLGPALTAVGRGLLFGTLAFLVVWGVYLFQAAPWAERSPWVHGSIDRRLDEGSTLRAAAHWVADELPLPLPVLPDALKIAKQETGRPWPCFLFGEIRSGDYLYFVWGMLLKSTPFFLLAVAAGAALWLRSRGERWWRGAGIVLVGAGVFLLGPSLSRMNIGVRHVLPVYAFLAVLAGVLLARRARWPRVAGILLLAGHAADSLLAHPDNMAYFTPFVRGNEAHYLRDSNLDWGQDVARLARHCAAEGIDELTGSVFGARYGTSPAAVGLAGYRYLQPAERPSGWFAVSYNHLAGIGLPGPEYEALERFSWLSGRVPRARIGKSILLYHLPPDRETQ